MRRRQQTRPAGDGQAAVEPTPFLDLVVESAVRRLEAIGAAGIVTPQALRRAGAEALAGAAMLAVAMALAWPMLARASEAAWIALVPQSIQVEVLPGDARVQAGEAADDPRLGASGRDAADALHARPDG